MTTLIQKLEWSKETLNKDGTILVGLSDSGIEVCLIPNKNSNIKIPLNSVLQLGSYLTFNAALKSKKYPKLSPLSLGYYLNILVTIWLFLTGYKHLKDVQIFDEWLSMFENPGNIDDFPFDKPLAIIEIQTNLLITTKTGVVLLDEQANKKWALPTMAFSHAQYISIS